MQDRVALITGASNGIGLALTRRLLTEDWQVIALVRSGFAENDPLIRESVSEKRLRIYKADLGDFDSLRAALRELKAREEKIDVLFNNAGGSIPELRFSKQGRELHFEVQTLVPYILLMELKEQLRRGTLKTVINTSSDSFQFTRKFDPDTLERPTHFKMLFGPYTATKLAVTLWAREIAPQLAAEGIKIRSVDPGGTNTLRRNKASGLPFFVWTLMKLFFPPPSSGAARLYEGALGDTRDATGVYVSRGKVKEPGFAGQGRKVLEKVSAIYAAYTLSASADRPSVSERVPK
ncbi:SDR family NAD(P)-dependent oxidoreductase [Hyalangium versicolor]|uniref:SDR family NAD(P)-dependent oxidoreductase n=1 Tax=Hyalangium versicolor TaxID=2861190 RepID=UPI001CCFA165|nr:SDR family NAD(P)-dependent oxidoreductase [Hyalangium versicolor]